MATLAAVKVTRAGINTAGAAASVGGDEFVNTGTELLFVSNGGGAPINVTVVTQATVDGMAVPDKVVAIPAGESRLIGPFPKQWYNDGAGKVQVTYSGVDTVTVKVIQQAM